MRVLVTGAAGRLGRKLAKALDAEHDLVLTDVARLDDARFVPLDVTDLVAARTAVAGCDAVVHMAILDWPPCSAREALRYAPASIQVHATGTCNMLQAALEGDVKRFVHISSVSALDGLPADTHADSQTRHYSNSIYGLTKGFGEDICRMFHCNFGLPIAVLRLGTIYLPEGDGAWIGNVFIPDVTKQNPLAPASSRVHADDVVRAIALALHVTDPAYSLVHIVGADSGGRWDLAEARLDLGWEPRYAFGPDGLPRAQQG
ncbi:MAG: NAD(P)-dependent oxidoreductase [Armatimonadetes bacterium]|nr:NAD(P)-dependent oxidoreductase [Armatimonadota bacterium]